MMALYGAAVVNERLRANDDGDVARYLKWEYGAGTGPGFLSVWAARRPSPKGRVKDVLAAGPRIPVSEARNSLEREMTLLAEWKLGRIPTIDLVDRLEELRQAEIEAPSACP